jgi:hypothetical protein
MAATSVLNDAPSGRFAAAAMADPETRRLFDARRKYLLGLDVAVVEIPNPLELHLFDAYAAMELDTACWNTFATH